VLIAIDGIDGAGKTTLAQSLADMLSRLKPLIEKEPTTHSEWGRRLKESAGSGRLSRDVELEYFHKDRVHHLQTVVKPALDAGRLVILDRYVDSTLAYQANTPEEAETLYASFVPEILVPDLTLILDCEPGIGLKRISKSRNGHSQFERRKTLKAASRIYRSRKGPKYVHIDARRSKEQVLAEVVSVLRSRFPVIDAALRAGEILSDADPSGPDLNQTCRSYG
jgi:dTMP kinase